MVSIILNRFTLLTVMLLSFSVKNWMSFYCETTVSLIATRSRQHNERVVHSSKYHIKILPTAAIFGGNASGKTNLFLALVFARYLIVNGTKFDQYIPVEPFRLDKKSMNSPTEFSFELLLNDLIYEYSFSMNKNSVLKEKLVIHYSRSDKVLFDRINNDIIFHNNIKMYEYLKFVTDGIWSNQLFLSNAASHKSVYENVNELKSVYDWFKESLVLITPNSRFGDWGGFSDEENTLFSTMSDILEHLDTGIVRLGFEDYPADKFHGSEKIKSKFEMELKIGNRLLMLVEPTGERFILLRKNDEIHAKKIVAHHRMLDGTETAFKFSHESHGSLRVVDLLPVFLDLSIAQQASSNRSRVCFIDDIDCCLHSNLTKILIESYLSNCANDSRSQLIFTTHDNSLMDQGLFRNDEMWATNREINGETSIFSLSDYKNVRDDKNLQKNYLLGRYGGVPDIQPSEIQYDFVSYRDGS